MAKPGRIYRAVAANYKADRGMVLEDTGRELIESCQRGDKDKVYSIALRYSGDEAEAMDIAQETFLKLFSCIRDYRGEASFESWLYRLVVNSCLDRKRRGALAAAAGGWAVGPGARRRRGAPAEVRSHLVTKMLRWLGGDENECPLVCVTVFPVDPFPASLVGKPNFGMAPSKGVLSLAQCSPGDRVVARRHVIRFADRFANLIPNLSEGYLFAPVLVEGHAEDRRSRGQERDC